MDRALAADGSLGRSRVVESGIVNESPEPVAGSTRVGLIGAGNISTTHARALAGIAGVRLAAVYAPRLEQAQALADSAGARACDALDRFFDGQPLDMVAVGTPSGLHGEHAA